jgi:hypothetical protein
MAMRMQAAIFVRRFDWPCRLLVALIAAGCSFPRPPDVKATAVMIRGTVHGLWTGADGVALRLSADGVDNTLLTVTANGDFTFPTALDEGSSYAIAITGNPSRHTCAIAAGANGVVGPEGASSLDVACSGPAVTVALSALAPWTFDPSRAVQPPLGASVALQDVAITVGSPDGLINSLAIAGAGLGLGVASPKQPLALGANTIAIDLAAQGGLSTTYQLVIERGGGPVAQAIYGKASNTGMSDGFGRAIAIDGDTLVVGASGESSSATTVNGDEANDNASNAGAAYVFQRTGGRWVQQAYLKASNAQSFDDFGVSVAISGDTIAVGAFGEDSAATGVNQNPADNNASFSGAVYVFHRSGTTWSQQAYVKASNTGSQDGFGITLALSGDTLAVGAYAEGSPATGVNQGQGDGAPGAGAVYVYHRAGASWSQEAYIKASNTQAGDNFGHSLALDGDLLAVGAPFEDSESTGVNHDPTNDNLSSAGAVYVFARTNNVWTQQAYLKASNTDQDDQFGWWVAMSGETVAVGAPGEASAATGVNGNESDDSAKKAGAVYVFRRTAGNWAQEAYLKASNTKATSEFGAALALRGDSLVVGSHLESNGATGVDGNQSASGISTSGAAYLFARSGTNWAQRAYLKASNTGVGDEFGFSVAISHDAIVIAASAEASDATGIDGDQSRDAASGAGAIYLFR